MTILSMNSHSPETFHGHVIVIPSDHKVTPDNSDLSEQKEELITKEWEKWMTNGRNSLEKFVMYFNSKYHGVTHIHLVDVIEISN